MEELLQYQGEQAITKILAVAGGIQFIFNGIDKPLSITDPIVSALLFSEFSAGDTVRIEVTDVQDQGFTFRMQKIVRS